MNDNQMVQQEAVIQKEKKPMKGFILAGIVILAIIIGAILYVTGAGSGSNMRRQLERAQRYLEELEYEQAVATFEAVIEIDPKCAQAYIGLADAYVAMGDAALKDGDSVSAKDYYENAINALEDGYAAAEDETIAEKLTEIQAKYDDLFNEKEEVVVEPEEDDLSNELLVQEVKSILDTVTIPLTVDDIVLGETSIEVAKQHYAGYEYVLSNLMNDDTVDTVYTMAASLYSAEELEAYGYSENQFLFLFSAPVESGLIDTIYVCDREIPFVCLGGLRMGDSEESVYEIFGLENYVGRLEAGFKVETADGHLFTYTINEDTTCSFVWEKDDAHLKITVRNGSIYAINIWRW